MNPIHAAQQFKAIAYLRWCLFRNGFRRKGSKGEVVARVIVFPVLAVFTIGPLALSIGSSFFAVERHHLGLLAAVFWAIFALQALASLQVSAPGLAFDPASLIRFPLAFPRYLVVRIFLGLLSVSTVVMALCLFGSAAGITFARPALGPAAFAAALALALANMFFFRMVLTWIDRWLATRRARELFTGLIIFFGIGIQYLNFTYNPGFNHHNHNAAKLAQGLRFYHAAEPVLRLLPPALAARAIVDSATGHKLLALAAIAAVLFWAAIFLAVFARRMHREYRGENLSEANNSPVLATPVARSVTPAKQSPFPTPAPQSWAAAPAAATAGFHVPPTVAACLYKEWIYLRRNTAQFYGLLAPIAMVFLFTLRMGAHLAHNTWLFPAAVAYSVLGVAALAYNSFGLDGEGVQFYFLAPVRMGDVLLAKNIFSFAVNLVEILIIYALITYAAGPPPLPTLLGTLCWLVLAVLINATVGNIRSITAPKKMDPSKLSRKQVSQLSGLMAVGITLAISAVGIVLIGGAGYLGYTWLPVPILAALAAVAAAFYWRGLQKIDTFAQNHRETMIEELAKAS